MCADIILDAEGHVKLADFGLAKTGVSDSTSGATSLCGESDKDIKPQQRVRITGSELILPFDSAAVLWLILVTRSYDGMVLM